MEHECTIVALGDTLIDALDEGALGLNSGSGT